MSLKEFTKEVFTRYGLTEDDIKVYLMYLRTPRATVSEACFSLEEGEIDYARVKEITNMLVEKNFLKQIDGIVNRYIPLEPYFELFINESELFRNEIEDKEASRRVEFRVETNAEKKIEEIIDQSKI